MSPDYEGLIMKTKCLAVVNQKGGVGKSTVAVHVVYAAREAGLNVLLVDLDRQGSSSITFLPEGGSTDALTSSALFQTESAWAAETRQAEIVDKGFGIVRADVALATIGEVTKDELKKVAARIKSLASHYDLCVLDTPGSIGLNPAMTPAALTAADAVICPFNIGLYEGQALADLWEYLKRIKSQGYNPKLRLLGLLPSKINTKSKEEREALAQLREHFGSAIMPHMLAERVAVKQSIMRRKPVWYATRGAGHAAAKQEWREATTAILNELGVMR